MNRSSLTVCAFESRRRDEMTKLIEKFGGIPTVAPSMREIPLDENTEAYGFAELLLNGEIDVVVFMTGVGTEALLEVLSKRELDQRVLNALQDVYVAVRGPKPSAVLSRLKVRMDLKAAEPNTWQQLVEAFESQNVSLQGKRVAVQEYGIPSREFYNWLAAQGAIVIPVPIYRWALPEETHELEQAIQAAVSKPFDVILWTSAQQVNHVLEVAEKLGCREEWLASANLSAMGSIGPTASERIREFGLIPDLEPSHPKMAHLIRESLEQAPEILKRKRS